MIKQKIITTKQNMNNYELFFSISIFFAFLVWFILLCYDPYGLQLNVFFAKMKQSFADFFYLNCYISSRNPYYSIVNGPEAKCYLPLSYILLYPFTVFHDYKSTTFVECFSSRLGVMSAVYWSLFCSLLLVHSLLCLARRLGVKARVVYFFLLSGIFLFSFERGNQIIIAASLVNYFLSFYDSEDIRLRYLASFALSVSSVLKIYPALFCVLYFKKKQYKEILITFIMSGILTFIPFVFFKNGFANIPKMISNMKAFSQVYGHLIQFDSFGFQSSILLLLHHFKFNDITIKIIFNIYRIIIYIFTISSLRCILSTKKSFNIIGLIIFTLIFLPPISWYYCGLYLFPLVLYFLSTTNERSTFLNISLLFCFFIILMPIQFGINTTSRFINLNHFLGNCICFVLWVSLIVDGFQAKFHKVGF